MKKTTYLFGLLLAFQTFTFAQYTAIPDANFEQALITFGYDSEGVLDGQILTADAESETGALSFTNQGIIDLTGIEAFVNIDGLNLSYNPGITSLDLSSNTLITNINLEEVNDLASLTLTGLSNLTGLNVFGTNLATLDLSTNMSMFALNARNSSLTSLDLSQNGVLSTIDVNNNELTSLDMRNGFNASVVSFNSGNNGNLSCIFVDQTSEPNLQSWSIDPLSSFVETEVECATLSRELNTFSQFNVYPNPATSQVTITSNVAKGQIEIFDITGKRLLTKDLYLGENTLNVSSLVSGVYLARISANGKIETKKLIIN